MKRELIIVALGIAVASALTLPVVASSGSGGGRRDFHIQARQYAFDPPRIIVDRGDEIHIRLSSLDVVHGFFLEGYDMNALVEPGKVPFQLRHPSEGEAYAPVEEVVFIANRSGKFRYRCSHTCGSLHPFMQGELIVRPNYPFLGAVGGAVGLCIAAFVVLFVVAKNHRSPPSLGEA